MPKSVDLSYFGPFFVSYPVDLSYPTSWLKPNTGAVLVPLLMLVQLSTPAGAGGSGCVGDSAVSVVFLELLSLRWRGVQGREHKTGGQRGQIRAKSGHGGHTYIHSLSRRNEDIFNNLP